MIIGAHSIIYSTKPEADRALLRDVLKLRHVDVGHGWLIFGLPPAEVAVHPSEQNDVHEFYLMCDDVEAFITEMGQRGVACGSVRDEGWGLLTQVTLPGGGKLGVYQPRHTRPMSKTAEHEAAIPNPALKPLGILVGDWSTVGTHPLVPGATFHGRTSFAWVEGGAFLMMRSQIDEPDIPSGTAVIGSDDASGEFYMLYFDERGVSRKYEVTLHDNVWKWWRNAPGFSQRFTGTIAADGQTIVGRGELSKDGRTWEGDLSLTYTRVSDRSRSK